MRNRIGYIVLVVLSILAISCDKESSNDSVQGNHSQIPDGYFEAVFMSQPETRAPVVGVDSRIKYLKYIIYEKNTGNFVKEKVIIEPSDPTQTWPLKNKVSEVLPYGQYKVIFLANVEKSLFGTNQTTDLLTGYTSNYADARINLPNEEFSNDNMFYMASVEVDPDNAQPYVLLQRIVNQTKIKRELVTKEAYLRNLAEEIFNTIAGDGGVLRVSVVKIVEELIGGIAYVGDNNSGLLGSLLGDLPLLGPLVSGLESTLIDVLKGISTTVGGVAGIGGTDFGGGLLKDNIVINLADLMSKDLNNIVDKILEAIREPVVDAIVDRLEDILSTNLNTSNGGHGYLEQQIASVTGGNTIVGGLLNPWKALGHDYAFITMNKMPKSVGFDLQPKEYFPDNSMFEYAMVEKGDWAEKYCLLYSLPGAYNIKEIDMRQKGLLGGLVVSGVLEDVVLGPSVVDIETPLDVTALGNRSQSALFGTLKLQVNNQENLDNTEANTLQLDVNLKAILATLGIWIQGDNGLVSGLLGKTLENLGVVIDRVTGALGLGTLDAISVPVKLPILDATNLTLGSGWQVIDNNTNN